MSKNHCGSDTCPGDVYSTEPCECRCETRCGPLNDWLELRENSMKIKVKILPQYENLVDAEGKAIDLVPAKATEGAAGYDLRSAVDVVLHAGKTTMVSCGFNIEVEVGFEAQVRPRSGLAAKHGITILNSPGTIDEDYRGEVLCIMRNFGDTDFSISRGMRIAQMVPAVRVPSVVERVEVLSATARGQSGFGSTGVK